MVRKTRETVEASFVSDRVTVHHAIIGESNDLFGDAADADIIEPTDLGACDVLITDCEGTERQILDKMSITPRELVIECHPDHDAPPHIIRSILEQRGYTTRTVVDDPWVFVYGTVPEDM
jgi:hypothetical protein